MWGYGKPKAIIPAYRPAPRCNDCAYAQPSIHLKHCYYCGKPLEKSLNEFWEEEAQRIDTGWPKSTS